MAEIIASSRSNGGKRAYKKIVKVDMTPLVDLGFLLITFFILTSSLAEPKATPLYMPADGTSSRLKATNALTVLLDANNRIVVYAGALPDAMAQHQVHTTSYSTHSGLGIWIRQQQKKLAATGAKEDLMLLIKPSENATYQNVIEALDEVQINNVKRYAIVPPDAAEVSYMAAH